MSGRLKFIDKGAGTRHYLEGRPVHCGDQLELELESGRWLHGRYETTGPIGREDSRALLVIGRTSAADNLLILLSGRLELRWPPDDIPCDCPPGRGWRSENDDGHAAPCRYAADLVIV